MKFYKVRLYEKNFNNKNYGPIDICKCNYIGQIIVKKGLLSVKEVITEYKIEISTDSIFIDPYKIKIFGRDLFVRSEDIIPNNLVTKEEVNSYINNYTEESFCLKNEISIINNINNKKKVKKDNE